MSNRQPRKQQLQETWASSAMRTSLHERDYLVEALTERRQQAAQQQDATSGRSRREDTNTAPAAAPALGR